MVLVGRVAHHLVLGRRVDVPQTLLQDVGREQRLAAAVAEGLGRYVRGYVGGVGGAATQLRLQWRRRRVAGAD